jgi:hypothetical protein
MSLIFGGGNNKIMKCLTIKWSSVQSVLEDMGSDVLLLLDCCNAGVASTDDGAHFGMPI